MDKVTKQSPDNVVQFPKLKLNSPPQSIEELSEQISNYRIEFAEDISELLMNMVVSELMRTGINIGDKEELISSIILVQESIKAVYLRACDIDHPFHEMADDFFEDSGFTIQSKDDTLEE